MVPVLNPKKFEVESVAPQQVLTYPTYLGIYGYLPQFIDLFIMMFVLILPLMLFMPLIKGLAKGFE